MVKYRKKSVVVEAFQMTEERRWDNSEWPMWLNNAWQKGRGDGGVWIDLRAPIAEGHKSAAELLCGTVRGVCPINWNDWIIQNATGELYLCKPDIFEATYDMEHECYQSPPRQNGRKYDGYQTSCNKNNDCQK